MTTRNRQPAGRPTGGQFAPDARASSDITLVPEDQAYGPADFAGMDGATRVRRADVVRRIDNRPGSTVDLEVDLPNLTDHLGDLAQEHSTLGAPGYLSSRGEVIAAHFEDRYGAYDTITGQHGGYSGNPAEVTVLLDINTSETITSPGQAHGALIANERSRRLIQAGDDLWGPLRDDLNEHERNVGEVIAHLELDGYTAPAAWEVDGLDQEVSRLLTENRQELALAREDGLTNEHVARIIGRAVRGIYDESRTRGGYALSLAAVENHRFEELVTEP